MKIPKGTEKNMVDLEEVLSRNSEVFKNDTEEFLNRVFILDSFKGYKLVGYKVLVNYFLNNGNASIDLDSRITADMILGVLIDSNMDAKKIIVNYYPFTYSEKRYAFDLIIHDKNINLYFPFVSSVDSDAMPKWNEVWEGVTKDKTEEEKIKFLSNTEPHFRKYTNQVIIENKMDQCIIYDPACSTGEFLHSIKDKFPDCYVIGHDMDPHMVELAKKYVDEYFCCNAALSPLKAESVDVLVIRFLNYDVVTLDEAYRIFDILLEKVKNNGYIICFGHTPVLIDLDFFKSRNLTVIQNTGYEESTNSIFQYYLMNKNI